MNIDELSCRDEDDHRWFGAKPYKVCERCGQRIDWYTLTPDDFPSWRWPAVLSVMILAGLVIARLVEAAA